MFAALLLLQTALPAPSWVREPRPLPRALEESSALARSPAHPGVLWTLNDSDNPADLFAIDTSGALLGAVRVTGARNVDWEALATGPCPAGSAARACLYIGDIGDNVRVRPSVTIYRVREPDPARDTTVPVLDSLRVVYQDGARDAESMAVDARGDLWIVSKERVRAPRLYRVSRPAWHGSRTATARFIDSLPIPSAGGIESWTTDASWSADGNALMVRTYGALWRVPIVGGIPRARGTRAICSLGGLGPQGEGLVALTGDLYAISSEKLFGSSASVAVVKCGA
jgi:hypothetical protein